MRRITMGNKFYKLELSGDSKSLQAKDIYFACVDDNGKVVALMNKPALDLTDDKYLREARLNVDMAYEKSRQEGLDGVKSWMLSKKTGKNKDDITIKEISSNDWIKSRAQIHKAEKLALVCQLEKTLSKPVKPRQYEDMDDLAVKEMRLARAEMLARVANKNEFSEYQIKADEARTVVAYGILKEKFNR